MNEREKIETLLHAPNISLTVMFDTVKIEIECSSDYAAQVLFDDLSGRLEAGQEISIEPVAKG
jgi:hypothetical protein